MTASIAMATRTPAGRLSLRPCRAGARAGVTLPDHVESDQIEASLDEGVLTVRVPKSERAQRRKIEIKA